MGLASRTLTSWPRYGNTSSISWVRIPVRPTFLPNYNTKSPRKFTESTRHRLTGALDGQLTRKIARATSSFHHKHKPTLRLHIHHSPSSQLSHHWRQSRSLAMNPPTPPLARVRTPGYAGYSIAWSPFFEQRLAVASSANYGLVGTDGCTFSRSHATHLRPIRVWWWTRCSTRRMDCTTLRSARHTRTSSSPRPATDPSSCGTVHCRTIRSATGKSTTGRSSASTGTTSTKTSLPAPAGTPASGCGIQKGPTASWPSPRIRLRLCMCFLATFARSARYSVWRRPSAAV